MKKLNELEEIADQLESLLKPDMNIDNLNDAFYFKNESPETIADELLKIDSEMKEYESKFDKDIKKLINIAESVDNNMPLEDISTIISNSKPIISSLKSIIHHSEKNTKIIETLRETYSEKQAKKNGYNNFKEFSRKFKKQETLKTFIKDVYGDRFKNDFEQLDSYNNPLYQISKDCRPPYVDPYFYYSKEFDFKKTHKNLYENLSKILFNDYKHLLDEITEDKKQFKTLSDEHSDILFDEYITQNYRDLIIKQEKDKTIQKEALSIFEEQLKIVTENRSLDKNREQIIGLKKRIHELPHNLQDIFRYNDLPDKKIISEGFNELVKASINLNENQKIKEVLKSLSEIQDRNCNYDFDNFIKSINDDFKLPKYTELSNINLENWNILKNNNEMKDLIGEISLNQFETLLRDATFEKLLITPSQTDQSRKLSYRAKEFKDIKSVPYNIINFWREKGYHLDIPFLSKDSYTDTTEAEDYIMSLDNNLLENIKELNIPGVIDIINIVKKDPTNFLNKTIRKDDKNIDNPNYTKIQESLMDLTIHYLENGSDNEKYFATDIAIDFCKEWKPINYQKNDKIFDLLIENIGLDSRQNSNLKKHNLIFLDKLIHARNNSPEDIISYKSEMIALSEYINQLEIILNKSKIPERLEYEAKMFYTKLIYSDDSEKDYDQVIKYLNAFESNITSIQEYLNNEDYGKYYGYRLDQIRTIFFQDKKSDKESILSELMIDLDSISDFIKISSEKIKSSECREILSDEQKRILMKLRNNNNFIDEIDIDYLKHYLTLFDDKNIALTFDLLDYHEKESLQSLSKQLYNLDSNLVEPILHKVINKKYSYNDISNLEHYLKSIEENTSFFEQYVNLIKTDPKKYSNLILELNNLAKIDNNSSHFISEINDKTLNLEYFNDNLYGLINSDINPTTYLLDTINASEDKQIQLKSWKKIMESFDDGKFDVTDEIHKNLEYTRFRKFVNNEKIKKHLKNNFSFADYLSIFNNEHGTENEFSEDDRFEIECVAHEAGLLKDYILKEEDTAKKIGKKTLVVPNISYGYLPVCPIVDELSELEIDFLIGTKAGSTESHNDKEVMNSRLFKGYRTDIIEEQPVIVVVDGTKHIISREGENKSSRYPDAYQSFLNQLIAINDSLEYYDIDYSDAGKSETDMVNLRNNEEFRRTVRVYKELNEDKNGEPYLFKFWNTADMDLIIRNYHQKIKVVKPFNPDEIKGPTMIFCNVGVLDEDIPTEIKDKYPELTHKPAYFDDSQKIIKFDFGFDEYGVRYLNRLENEVKKAYGTLWNKNIDPNRISEFIKFNSMKPTIEAY